MEHAALLDRIRAVDPAHAETMGRQPTTFAAEPLPFYRRFMVVTASVHLPHDVLVLRYADDGAAPVPLEGEPSAVYRVNDAEALRLAPGDVADYVRFFLASTRGPDGRARLLVETPADVLWLRRSAEDPAMRAARDAASARIHPLAVFAAGGGYRVVALVIEEQRLVELTLAVDGGGRVSEDGASAVAEGLPVALTK
jgi:hypothetical protein